MPYYKPYGDDAANAIYNLLFCDDHDRFKDIGGEFAPIFAAPFDEGKVRAIAENEQIESRLRVLAFNRLNKEGAETPRGVLLGAIAEVPLDAGLDALAAYADGRVRYINQTGAIVVIEEDVAPLSAPVQAFLEASRALVQQIGPWTGERLAPPSVRNVRLTFLVSDGLYFGEGDMGVLARDPLGGPVFNAAARLLAATVEFASGDGDAEPGSR